jgi:hypothetical protein
MRLGSLLITTSRHASRKARITTRTGRYGGSAPTRRKQTTGRDLPPALCRLRRRRI